MSEANGVALPKITVTWNENLQMAMLDFSPQEFRTWDFVIAVLEMAKRKAEDMVRISRMQAIQQQVPIAAKDNEIGRLLHPR